MEDVDRPANVESSPEPRGARGARVEPKAIGGVMSLERRDRIRGHRGSRRDPRQRAPVRSRESKRTVLRARHARAFLVKRAVMAAAQEEEIRQGRGPTLGPVLHVMPLPHADLAAREATRPIAMAERSPQRGRDRACPGADLHRPAMLIVSHHNPARIACEAPQRSRGNVAHLLQLGLAGRLRVCQHRGIDMDDHLVPLAGRAGGRARGAAHSRRAGPAHRPAAA
jgi:hypothetical protein